MTKPIERTDYEEVARIAGDYSTSLRNLSTSELGSMKDEGGVECPCCGKRFTHDPTGAARAILRRKSADLHVKTAEETQHWLTNAWGWKSHSRATKDWRLNRLGVQSDHVRVFTTALGKGARQVNRIAERKGLRPHFLVLMHDVPTYADYYFATPIGDLFTTLAAIAEDSPDFARRLGLIARTAGASSRLADHVAAQDADRAGDRRQGDVGGVQIFDIDSAVEA